MFAGVEGEYTADVRGVASRIGEVDKVLSFLFVLHSRKWTITDSSSASVRAHN
jgi:hypothetical protein